MSLGTSQGQADLDFLRVVLAEEKRRGEPIILSEGFVQEARFAVLKAAALIPAEVE